MSDGSAGHVRNEISGGELHGTVVQAGIIEQLNVGWRRHVGVGLRGFIATFGVVLLVARPELPLPHPYQGRAWAAGWLLLGGAFAAELLTRLQKVVRERRRREWTSDRSLDRATGALAEGLYRQYDQDERLAQINGPHPITVTWLPADGRGAASISEYFTTVPHQRLVVLGGAGAGKTIFALRLAHGLLRKRSRAESELVPAVVPLASWDPREGLLRWVAGRLAAEHPAACTPVAGARPEEVAFKLLSTRRVLPVLDGFDELPAPVREDALKQLAASMKDSRFRFVLTSRPQEYEDHRAHLRTFHRTEITLQHLSDDAVAAHLNPDGAADHPWADALAEVRRRSPEAEPLSTLLRVPLMVELARVAYGRAGSRPSDLLDRSRFGTAEELERHLYDAFVEVVYSDSHDTRAAHGGWARTTATDWVGFLAQRMRAENSQEFAWWQLDESVPAAVRVLRFVPAFAVAGLAFATPGFDGPWWGQWVKLPTWCAFGGLALVLLLLVGGLGESERRIAPQRLVRPDGTMLRQAAARWPVRIAGGLAVLVLGAGWLPVVTGLWEGARWPMAVVSAGAVGVGVNRAVNVLWQPADPAHASSPSTLLRGDRRAVLAFGWLPGKRPLEDDSLFVLTLTAVPVLGWWQLGPGRDFAGIEPWLALAPALLLSGALYAIAVSAWGRYTVARLWFAAAGKLPWRLMAFLEDANARGVLRQAGGTYTFRHIELRNRLADTADAKGTRQVPSEGGRRTPVWRIVLLWVTVPALLVAGSGPLRQSRVPGPVRALPGVCSLVSARDVSQLMSNALKKETRSGCTVIEQSPFAPDKKLDITASLFTGDKSFSSSERAAATFGAGKKSLQSDKAYRDIPGIGDDAYAIVNEFWHKLLQVRAGNLVLSFTYTEEYGNAERSLSLAEVLARDALQQLGLGSHLRRGQDAGQVFHGTLADIPRPSLPNVSRFTQYQRDRTDAAYGATWKGEENSKLWSAAGVPFIFRAPRDIWCRQGDEGTSITAICENSAVDAWGDRAPYLQLKIAAYFCAQSCNENDLDAFERELPVDSPDWIRVGGIDGIPGAHLSTSYATSRLQDGDANRYRSYLWRRDFWTDKDGHPVTLVLWVRAEVDQGNEEAAQKIINDIYAHTGGKTF